MHREPQALHPLARADGLAAAATRRAAAVLGSLAVVLLLYLHTTQSLLGTWLRSDTYAHGLVVFPLFAYMVWSERARLALSAIRPCLPALGLVALAGFAWLLGRLSNSLVVEQFAMVALVPAAVWSLLGTAALRVLAFPFVFLFLAVPFGDFLVPHLIDLTADFTVAAVRASGVPIFRRGNTFEIPSGSWSVVEACSGIRYLMASVLGGMLFAWFFFRGWKQRAAMVLLAVVVAVIGNWLRAYLIVMLGHVSNNELAAGVDHIVYGWLFFGVLIALLFGVGLAWARRQPGAGPAPTRSRGHAAGRRRTLAATLLAAALVSAWPLADAMYGRDVAPVAGIARIAPAGGWHAAGDAAPGWRPNYAAHALLHQTFAHDGNTVGVYVAYYRGQHERDELIQSRTTVTGPDNLEWAIQRPRRVRVDTGGDVLQVNAAAIHGAGRDWEVWQWYWIGGRVTGNSYLAKAWLAFNQLLGRGDDAASVMVYTPASGRAERDLHAFVAAMRPSIDTALRSTRATAGGQ